MSVLSQPLRLRLGLLLALSLLFLGWFQLHHELTAHLEHPDSGCVICVFTGHLGNGATPARLTLPVVPLPHLPVSAHYYTSPTLTPPFLLALSLRGPPTHSSLI